MSALFQFFLFLLTLNNLALLGMGRLRTLINLVTAQGILLGGLLLIHDHALLAVAVLLIKGGLLPWLLHRTRRQIGADPHIKPRLGFGLAVLTGLCTALEYGFYLLFFRYQGVALLSPRGIVHMISELVGGALIAGVFSWLLFVAVAKTGALDHFASGRAVHVREE